MIHKTSLAVNVAKLDEELLRYVNRIADATPSSFLTIPIQHPTKDYTALLVCLVDCTDGDETSHVRTIIVQECFR